MQDLAPLQELERMRAEFPGMVSHELRVPLTSIKGSTARRAAPRGWWRGPRRASSSASSTIRPTA